MENWTDDIKKQIAQGILALAERGEDHEDEFVLESFYDYDLIHRFMNKKNQIIQGSRGMGKTHILKVLERTLGKKVDKTIYCIYFDCRPIGSGGMCNLNDSMNSFDQPFNKPTRFFEYFLERFYQRLQAFYNYQYYEPKIKNKIFSMLSDLRNSITTKNRIIKNTSTTFFDSNNTAESASHSGSIAMKGVDYARNRNRENVKNTSKEEKQDAQIKYSLTFSKFSYILEELLEFTDTRIIFLLDEWTSIPTDIQPYFAEFLRRTLFPISRIKFKIAIIPQGNQFQSTINGQTIGLAIGDDVKFELDLDRIYSVDSSPLDIVSFCFGFLCKHLSAMLKACITEHEFTQNMFINQKSALMLVRASEGNPRDFILLAARCVRGFLNNKDFAITDTNVILEARELYENSKLKNITQSANNLLIKLIRYVIYQNKNRGFLIDQECISNSDDLRTLINARIIHILKENIMDYEKAVSGSCALLILNFGTYCEALGAGKPINLFAGEDALEHSIFGKKEDKPYDPLLIYDKKRKIFVCYVNTFNDNNFVAF